MHVLEDVREGSDVPEAQPSSPGHAEQRINNGNDAEPSDNNDNSQTARDSLKFSDANVESSNGGGDSLEGVATTHKENETGHNSADNNNEEKESTLDAETNSIIEDGDSNDSAIDDGGGQYSKRKSDAAEPPPKRLRSDLEQSYILRDKILNEYLENSRCSSPQQMQVHIEQILSEIKTLNDLAREKEREWNNIIHLKKIKEELLLRIQRRKQVLILNEKIELSEQDVEERCGGGVISSGSGGGGRQSLLKCNTGNSGMVIYSMQNLKHPVEMTSGLKNNMSKQIYPSATIEINGQSCDFKQSRRPVLDVQSIIADYRQRHPEAVPRRGRRIRSVATNMQGDSSAMVKRSKQGGVTIFSSLSLGSGSQVKHNLQTAGVDGNSELGLLLTAVDNAKQSNLKSLGADGSNPDKASFKDVLMQFAKLSQNEKQDLLQSAVKGPPHSEVTVHPVSGSSSLLHGILTKTQSSRGENSKSTFSPTLARLLTAPERASSPHTNNHCNSSVSISDMLSSNKARNEITITPVGGQFDANVKEKVAGDEEEMEDSADRLVIDESEGMEGRNRIDNGSDAGDEVPQCQGCNQKPAQFVCAGCGNQWYCSRECQVVAWDEHSEVCSG